MSDEFYIKGDYLVILCAYSVSYVAINTIHMIHVCSSPEYPRDYEQAPILKKAIEIVTLDDRELEISHSANENEVIYNFNKLRALLDEYHEHRNS